MGTYYNDILSQYANLKNCIDGLRQRDLTDRLLEICGREHDAVVFTGMGSSNYCAIPSTNFLARRGVRSLRCSASELLNYSFPILTGRTLLIANSQSGESVEIVKLMQQLPEGIDVIAVTNDTGSTLARRATVTLPMNAEPELSVTTRTYLASIVIDLLISHAIAGHSFGNFLQYLLKALDSIGVLLKGADAAISILCDALGFPPQLCLLGRGPSYASACAGSLFLREVARYPAFPELCGEFRHGPMEMVDERFSGIVIAPNDATLPLQIGLARDIRAHGGRVVAIANRELSDTPTVVVPESCEWLSPILTIVPIQLYAEALARHSGIEAGVFRWGGKITRTE